MGRTAGRPAAESFRQRMADGRAGPGNWLVRGARGLMHGIMGNDLPLDDRGTVNWWGGERSVANAAARGAIDPTGLILRGPEDSSVSNARPSGRPYVRPTNLSGARAGSVVAQGFVGNIRDPGVSGPGPLRPAMPRDDGLARPSEGAGREPIRRDEAQVGPVDERGMYGTPGSGLQLPGGAGGGRSGSWQRGLGAGVRGDALGQAIEEMSARQHSRGGLMAER